MYVQAVYSALLPPSLMSDGIFSEKIVYFFEVMSLLGHILRKKECWTGIWKVIFEVSQFAEYGHYWEICIILRSRHRDKYRQNLVCIFQTLENNFSPKMIKKVFMFCIYLNETITVQKVYQVSDNSLISYNMAPVEFPPKIRTLFSEMWAIFSSYWNSI